MKKPSIDAINRKELAQVDPDDYLGKAKVEETVSRIADTSSLKSIVDKIAKEEAPEGTEYIGAVVCPVYIRKKLDGNFEIELHSHQTLRTNSMWLVNKILRHLCIGVARDYGFQLTKKQKTEIREQ